jgi:hypothetical protein
VPNSGPTTQTQKDFLYIFWSPHRYSGRLIAIRSSLRVQLPSVE